MKLDLYSKSRDGILYSAKAVYDDGNVIVLKGSRINNKPSIGYKPRKKIEILINDRSKVDEEGNVLKDIIFNSLSTAATFVTGRSANGMIVWKTLDGKNVRDTLKMNV